MLEPSASKKIGVELLPVDAKVLIHPDTKNFEVYESDFAPGQKGWIINYEIKKDLKDAYLSFLEVPGWFSIYGLRSENSAVRKKETKNLSALMVFSDAGSGIVKIKIQVISK